MNLMDKRKLKPFWLVTDGRVYKPQPSGKALLRAALIFGLAFLIGVLLVLRQLRLL
jgi:hypothetical protein